MKKYNKTQFEPDYLNIGVFKTVEILKWYLEEQKRRLENGLEKGVLSCGWHIPVPPSINVSDHTLDRDCPRVTLNPKCLSWEAY